MPSSLGRNLNLCFTKIKCPLTPQSPHTPQPQTPDDLNCPLPTSTLIKNFNSLYDYTFDSTSKSLTDSSSSLSSESDTNSEIEPDFATIYASQRFFFTSPGRSNSIIESIPSIATTPDSSSDTAASASASPSPVNHSNQPIVNLCNQSHDESLQSWRSTPTVKDGVAVSTYSPDPYMDFRRSMQEMVEARDMIDVKANWDYLHELLLCYLALNPKSTHKFIIGAFADLLVSLMPPAPAVDGGHRESELDAGGCRFQGSAFHV